MYNNDLNGNGTNGRNQPSNFSQNSDSSVSGSTVTDFKKLFRLLVGYKWIILLFVVASTTGMYLYTESVVPVYQGEGIMLIQQSQDSYVRAGNDLNSMLSSSFGVGRGSTIANELGIFKSRQFAESIADQILESPYKEDGQLYPILWSNYPEDSTQVNRNTLANRIQRNITVMRGEDRESDMIIVTFDSHSPHEAANITNMILDSYTRFSSDRNREQVRSALNFLNQEMATVQRTLNEKEEALRTIMHGEKLVELDAQTRDIISTLSQLESERQAIEIQRVGLNSSINNYRNELDRIRPGFAQKYSEGLSTRLSRYQYQLAELETERMLLRQRNPNIDSNPDGQQTLQRLDRDINNLRNEITTLAEDFIQNDDHALSFFGSPDGDLAARVVTLSQQLTGLEVDAQLYDAQAEVLDRRLNEYQRTFDRLPDNLIEFARIQRDIETNEQLYLSMSAQIGELTVWEQTQTSLGRVVDYSPIPSNPIEPRTQLLLVWGFIMGLILSFGLVYVREMGSTRIDSIEKLIQKRLTLLSVIPDVSSQKSKLFGKKKYIEAGDYKISADLITVLDPISYASEAYRRLLSNIMFSQTRTSYKSILVTSPNTAEGKSTMIANLAAVYAESDKKVALVDCDFRQPAQHRLWGLDNSTGAADFLMKNSKLDSVIQKTVVKNIHVVTTGTTNGNPAQLVQNKRMEVLIDELKKTHDIVLLDTPPFGFITDAAPLMQYVDGLVLVTRFNQSKEAELDQCLGNLRKVSNNIIGMVMMSFNYKKASYYLETTQFKSSFENYNRYNKNWFNKQTTQKKSKSKN